MISFKMWLPSLYPLVSPCISLYPLVSACIPFYPLVSPIDTRGYKTKRSFLKKNLFFNDCLKKDFTRESEFYDNYFFSEK